MAFLKSIFLAFTIWVLAALLNALLGGSWLYFFSRGFTHWPAAFFLVFIFTLILAAPGIFIFWIVLLVKWNEGLLFRYLLKTGLVISALSTLILYILPIGGVEGQQLFLSLCIVIAAITSIMIHHHIIKSASTDK
jgi:hypothetical protein